jgi:hypothetical protein
MKVEVVFALRLRHKVDEVLVASTGDGRAIFGVKVAKAHFAAMHRELQK